MIQESKTIEEKFGVLDSVPVGACLLRDDFVVLFWNACLEDWTKIPRDQMLGTKITTHFPHLSQLKYATRFQQIFAGGPPTIFSSQIHKHLIPATWQDGQQRIQQTTVTAVPALSPGVAELDIASLARSTADLEPEGTARQPEAVGSEAPSNIRTSFSPYGFVASNSQSFYALLVIQDVTDLTHRIQAYRTMRDQALEEVEVRQRVEEELRSSQHFIQQIADAAPYLLYIYDLTEQRNVYVNGQAFKLLGYHPEEILQMETALFSSLVHPDDLEKVSAHLQKFPKAQDGSILELEYRLKHRSGEWRWFRCRDQVFARTASGEPKQIFGTAQDITEYKRAEEALRQQNERELLMATITQHIRQSLDLGEVLGTTVIEVRQFLQADRVMIVRFNPSTGSLCAAPATGAVTVESVAPNCKPMLGETLEDFCFDEFYLEAYQHRAIRPVADVSAADLPPNQIDWLAQFAVRAYLVVPLVQGDELWGLLMAHQCRPRQWMQLEVELLSSLATQLAIAIKQAELYQQLQAANLKLERLATLDALTQLANRRRFDQYLEIEWRRQAREQTPLSLILCDIDSFKSYNDTYGHPGGDECLRQVACAIGDAVDRPADLVARYGGEEFAVILPNTEIQGAVRVAEHIQLKISALQVPHAGSQVSQYVTVSLGVASMVPAFESGASILIAAADRALYEAKRLGRDRIQVYQPDPTSTKTNGKGDPVQPVEFSKAQY
ncbi:diguanylate cyclase domain-containing protein [Tychonema sp. LEGE 07203]|uniref:sensor domain-containing diguanylate cyclase n=1 Tax=Tychonema sp. LEGE 07203 TaxID=1828671 RepID=UPI001D13D59D|nr:diguanylate cyclase [Tychonema sp. LEGE 07203]